MLYIHGYGSTGNAHKAKELAAMFPDRTLVAPTFDYNHLDPGEVFRQLREIITREQPDLIVGSSTGGYYALCCTLFYDGPVWCINPVRDVLNTLRHVVQPLLASGRKETQAIIDQRMEEYAQFDREVFQQLHPRDGQLHFALSTDDEVLGSHQPLLSRFPNYGSVVWKDHCGHRFFRFDELQADLQASL